MKRFIFTLPLIITALLLFAFYIWFSSPSTMNYIKINGKEIRTTITTEYDWLTKVITLDVPGCEINVTGPQEIIGKDKIILRSDELPEGNYRIEYEGTFSFDTASGTLSGVRHVELKNFNTGSLLIGFFFGLITYIARKSLKKIEQDEAHEKNTK